MDDRFDIRALPVCFQVHERFGSWLQAGFGFIHFSIQVHLDQVFGLEGANAGLRAGEQDLMRLTEVKGARRPHATTGLYHFALLYPNRKELARAEARA
jgi:hypothetical protein